MPTLPSCRDHWASFARSLATVCAILTAPAWATTIISLPEAWDLARQHNPTWQAAQHTTHSQQLEQPVARGALLPHIHWEGQALWLSQRVDHQTNRLDTQSSTWTLSQALVQPADTQAVRAARATATAATWHQRNVRDDLMLQVSTAYFDVVQAKALSRLADTQLDLAAEQLKAAKSRLELGMSVQADWEEAQAAFDTQQAKVLESHHLAQVARLAWQHLMGHTIEADVARLRHDATPTLPCPSLAEWRAWALDGNTALQEAAAHMVRQHHQVGQARAGYLPVIASALQHQDQKLHFAGNTQVSHNDAVQLTINWALLSGGSTRAATRAAQATWQASVAARDQAKRDALLAVETAYQSLQAEQATLQALEQAVQSGTAAWQATQVGLQAGTRTQADVLDQLSQLYAQKRRRVQSQLKVLSHWLQLRQAAGLLSSADLQMLSGYFVGSDTL